ncbi:MAG: hypothetical protein LBS89_06500 [Zoogloeaceae bacterium]|jgi:hypothetical protein|nr:hypothetical protein [Zoogloeaceae bacterium]
MTTKHLFFCGFLMLLWVSPVASPAEKTTGRLFFTPAERAQLEQAKRQPAVAPKEKPALPPRHYQGVAQRQNGPATVWLDGQPEETRAIPHWPVGEYEERRDLLRGGQITIVPARP